MDLLKKANAERESGNFEAALATLAEAKTALQADAASLAEAYASEFLTYRHLLEKTGDENYKQKAQSAIEASVKTIRDSGQKVGLAIPLYNLGKWYDTIGQYEQAREEMKNALAAFDEAPDDPQAIASVKAEIATRIASIEYRLGDDAARARFDTYLSDLISSPHPDSYTQHVWVSGAHMHLAEAMLSRGDQEGARVEVAKARIVIDADPALTLRKQQLEKLSAQIA